MCAYRNFNQVQPHLLAQQYRLNISQPTKKPVVLERKKKETGLPQIQIEAANSNSKLHFSWPSLPSSLDENFDMYDDEEDIFYQSRTATPYHKTSQESLMYIYEKACKKNKLLPLACIKNGLLKQTLSCRFVNLQKTDCKCICYALCNDRFVERIEFQQNGMGPEPAHYFAEVIQYSSFLTHVKIADNDLRSEGASIICNAIIDNKMIICLDLSGNSFVENDGEHFEKLIEKTDSLRELYLGHNELMDQGVRKISQALKSNVTLQVLDLSWNHIRLKGAEAIGEALEQNNSLLTVNLAWNGLHQDGATSIARALQNNDTLTELDLTCNRLSEYCIAEILRGLDSNSTLETLRLGQNHVTTRGALTILKHIKENKQSGISFLDFGNQEVHDKFVELYQEIQKERDLKIQYGMVWSTDRTPLSQSSADEDEVALLSCNPLTVLMECMRLQNMRLLDFFKSLDTNISGLICINELCDGLMKVGIPLHRQTLLQLLNRLDVDNNRQLDYGEMVEAQHIHRRNLRKIFASSSEIKFEDTEIGRVSVIVRKIMSKNIIMKTTGKDTRMKSSKRNELVSRSNTPSPFQLEHVETNMSGSQSEDYLTFNHVP
ncbi:leucine-rich repeat-containing protein 74A-like [Mercenaria mercenaria]|uniref:leucine-rich repeat-containing protein 74A-like n=1 Tax=Mercenaria mercenaria TaxID=6596 RepID=UPI00234E747A|nr:leucine-rich repeat-containing protein 74A-like [Mercenaria mercenaria]